MVQPTSLRELDVLITLTKMGLPKKLLYAL
jgi:hypothetical protein